MRTERKRIPYRNKLQDKYSTHPSKASWNTPVLAWTTSVSIIFSVRWQNQRQYWQKCNKDSHTLTARPMHLYWRLFRLSSGIRTFWLANQNPLNHLDITSNTCTVASWQSPLGLQQLWKYCVWFLSFLKMHCYRGGGEEGTGVKWASHPNRIINIMLSDFLDLPLFWCPLFDTLKL